MKSLTRLLFLRHGETDISKSGAYAGSRLGDLTKIGTSQALRWEQEFKAEVNLFSLSSDYGRALDTAKLAGTEPEVTELLREWDLGELEGQNAQSYRIKNPDWNLFADGPPNKSGESCLQIQTRAQAYVEYLESRKHVGLTVSFTHGQFIKVLASNLLKFPLESAKNLSIGPARGMLIEETEQGNYRLLGWNVGATNWPDFSQSKLG